MNNIEENSTLVAHRGQLYGKEERNPQFFLGKGAFAHGNGWYFTTGEGSYSEASTYGSDDPAINRDFGPCAERLAEQSDISYSEAKDLIRRNANGKVLTAIVIPKRMMTFGGDCFMDIGAPKFEERFDYALVLLDVPSDERASLLKFVVAHNSSPEKVGMHLIGKNLGGVMREYASLCNCDAIKLSSNIAPSGDVHKGVCCEHIVVFDRERFLAVRYDDPITIDPDVFWPNVSPKVRYAAYSTHLQKCEDKSSDIKNSFAVTMTLAMLAKPDSIAADTNRMVPELVVPIPKM